MEKKKNDALKLPMNHLLHLRHEAKKLVGLVDDKDAFIKKAEDYCMEHGLEQWALDVAVMFEEVWNADEAKAEKCSLLPKPIGANDLWHKHLQPPEWILPGFLPTGLTLLAGKPKSGKSWFAYDLVLAMAGGGEVLGLAPTEGPALMLALEDTEWRLKSRMRMLCLDEPPSNDAHLLTHCGDLPQLRALLEQTPYKLIVIDTFARFRPKATGNTNAYAKDYEDIAQLKALADEFQTSVVLVHHTRKQASSDPFDEVSGTFGINGGADSIMVLKRETGTDFATLHIRGRDVQEQSIGLRFDQGKWRRAGEFTAVPNAKQAAIMALLENSEPLSPKQVTEHILGTAPDDKEVDAMRQFLKAMAEKLFIAKIGHGKYGSITKEQEKAL